MKSRTDKEARRLAKKIREKQTRIGDGTDALINHYNLAIGVYHIASGLEVGFKAMVTDFKENYKSSWNSEQVYGRSDPITTFSNTQRSISLSWQVAGSSVDECRENKGRVGLLISMLYPTYKIEGLVAESDYNPVGTISASPLVRLKFSNMIHNSTWGSDGYWSAKRDGLLGNINNLNVEPDKETGYIVLRGGGMIPKIFNVSLDFTVIHEQPVGWGNGPKNKIATFDSGKIRGLERYGLYPYGGTHKPRENIRWEPDGTVDEEGNVVRAATTDADKPNTKKRKKSGPENSRKAQVNKHLK